MQHIATAGTSPNSIRKNVTSLAGYCNATVFASASTTAKQNIEASMLPMALSESERVEAVVGDDMS